MSAYSLDYVGKSSVSEGKDFIETKLENFCDRGNEGGQLDDLALTLTLGVGRHGGAEKNKGGGGGIVWSATVWSATVTLPTCRPATWRNSYPACLARQIAPQSAQQSEGIPWHTPEGFTASEVV